MKVYIGNKTLCLGERVEKEGQDGYLVRYSDESETWLTKEIFEFEFRQLEEEEIDLVLSTVIAEELTAEDVMEMMDLDALDAEGFDLKEDILQTDNDGYALNEVSEDGK